MLRLFTQYATLFNSWRVLSYEQESASYMLHIEAQLRDGSRLIVRDYLFRDGQRKYAY